MAFITSDPTAIYRHALNAWVSPLATCALPKGVCYLLTYLLLACFVAPTPPRDARSIFRRRDPYPPPVFELFFHYLGYSRPLGPPRARAHRTTQSRPTATAETGQ